ncbi:protein kinase [Myxococcota bacterium]
MTTDERDNPGKDAAVLGQGGPSDTTGDELPEAPPPPPITISEIEVLPDESGVEASGESVVAEPDDDGDGGSKDEGPSLSLLRPGTLIAGQYEIRDELGVGGMGRIYLAFDRRMKREVALKLMRGVALEHEHADQLKQRFDVESVLPAQINHPNVITIYDRGEHQGMAFFVMEYMPGSRTLHEVVDEATKAGTLVPLDTVKAYFAQLGAGLAAIHGSKPGIWHRDIKLANLLVAELAGGVPLLKILDFGIAHDPDSGLTLDGDALGTPACMAPEFFEYENDQPLVLDSRADLFAVGVALYRTLTGKHPYPKISSLREAMMHYQSKDKDKLPLLPSHHRPDLPPGWDFVIMKLLERDRTKRYQTAEELCADLQRLETLGPYTGDGARCSKETPTAPRGKPLSIEAARAAPVIPTELQSQVAGDPDTPQAAPLLQPEGKPEEDQERRKTVAKLVIAGAVAIVAFVVVALVVSYAGKLKPVADVVGEKSWTMPGGTEGRDEWVDETKEGQAFLGTNRAKRSLEAPGSGGETSLSAESVSLESTETMPASRNVDETAPLSGSGDHEVTKRTGKRRRPRPAADSEEALYAKLYGTRENLNTGTVTARVTGGEVEGTAPEVKGQRLPVKLIDDVASSPIGAAVIARLTKPSRLGEHRLPVGTEVHGKIAGAQGTRVFVRFEFARLKAGKVIGFRGVARGTDGRAGIPGKKLVDSGTASSVAAKGTESAVKETAGKVAEVVGDAIGSETVRSAGSEAAEKAERMDSEELVVVAKRNTAFTVYVEAMGKKKEGW